MDLRPEAPTALAVPADVMPAEDAVATADALPVTDALPATDAAAATASNPGGSRARWLIGGGIAIAAAFAIVLAAALLGARPLPEVLKYVPADSAVVIELRPELPGDQRQHLGNFLAHFPGFADQSILDSKIDEALARLIGTGSGGAVEYATQVKPLLAGPMAMSIGSDGLRALTTDGRPSGMLLVATTDGEATCDSVFGTTTAGEAHRGVEIRTVPDSLLVSCASHGRFMLIGDARAIRSGVDARLDGKGVDGSSTYRTARASLEGDQLATLYADGEALEDLFLDAVEGLGQPLPQAAVPPWTIAGLRVVDDALIVDAYAPPIPAPSPPSGAPSLAPMAESRFAATLPADTLGYMEVRGVGALLTRGFAQLREDPAQAEALAQLERALLMLGGADNLVGWIEEMGIAVVPSGDSVGGALLIRGADADAAAARVTQVRNLLVLAATGTDMTVRNTEYDGVTITTVDLGDLSTLLGGFGVPGEFGDARLQFAIAARDDLVVVGVGEGVVEQILDVDPASSLKASASYGRAIQLAGTRNDLQFYIAIDSTIALLERLIPPDQLGSFEADVKPYLAPLAAMSWASTTTGTAAHARIVLTVK